jgi:6-phosphofructokinase 1
MTFGFDTAVSIATEAIDRIHTTAESHDRVMVVEVMGRYTGWIAAYSGIAGGADAILIPEEPFSLEEVVRIIRKRHERGRDFSIVVVAEGAKFGDVAEKNMLVVQDARMDEFGHVKLGGIGNVLAREIEDQTGYETRVTVLGHIQRGGTPTAFDRVLATRFGVFAADLVLHGKFGHMAALRGMQIADVPLKEATGQVKKLDKKIFEVAKVFFG